MLYVQKILVTIKISEELRVKTCILNLIIFFLFMILNFVKVIHTYFSKPDITIRLSTTPWSSLILESPSSEVSTFSSFLWVFLVFILHKFFIIFRLDHWMQQVTEKYSPYHGWPRAAVWACCTAVLLISSLFSTPNILFPRFSIFFSPLLTHLVLVKQSSNRFLEKIQTGGNTSEILRV